MPSGSHDELPQVEIVPGYSSRLADWGGMTVAFEKAHAGQDASSMVKGLPDDRCQAPHWGYVFSGRMTVDYGDRQETIEGGQAYYIAPGHLLSSRPTARRSSSRRRTRSSRRWRPSAGTTPPARRSAVEPSPPSGGVTELYDLRVTVERIDGRSVRRLEVGGLLRADGIQPPADTAPASTSASTRCSPSSPCSPPSSGPCRKATGSSRTRSSACPDPDERVIMRIERIGRTPRLPHRPT